MPHRHEFFPLKHQLIGVDELRALAMVQGVIKSALPKGVELRALKNLRAEMLVWYALKAYDGRN